jgi:hypothetical protein
VRLPAVVIRLLTVVILSEAKDLLFHNQTADPSLRSG